jgi:deoxyribonuclease-4
MPKDDIKQLLIGAHTSTAGGIEHALLEGQSIGATTVQLFTSNQRQWKGRVLTEEMIAHFQHTLIETHLKKIMSHASYLINLASTDEVISHKSRQAFREEIERCLALEISYLNFHPGAALKESREHALDILVQRILEVEDLFVDDSTRLLLETTAGQGSTLGCTFEELKYILDRTHTKVPIGICIDTCHIFVSGYDLRSEHECRKTFELFDDIIGIEHLYALHLNDSVHGLNSRKDRHAPLGEGEIGMECFKFLMTTPSLRKLPKYLETPGGPPLWDKEIWQLREFAKGVSPCV